MGIERFFSTISRTFGNVFEIQKNTKCKYFFIDFNSIVHVISSELQKEYEEKKISINTSSEFIKIVLDRVLNILIDEILTFAEGVEFLFISTDGVPTRAKMLEQRRRRYSDFILANTRKEILRDIRRDYDRQDYIGT